MKKDIFVIILVSIIWICKPIPYETLAYRIHQREETVSKGLAVASGGGQGENSNSFIPMDPISRGSSQGSGQGFNPKPRLPYSLGGEGGGSGGGSFDDNNVPPKSEWETDPNYWDNYQYDPSEWKKKKQNEPETCLIPQNKAGIDELPNSLEYLYDIEGKAAKQELQRVWNDPETKKEALSKLEKINNGELTPRNQKSLTGFKKLKEYKFNKIRIIVNPGQKGAPDTIVGIVKRSWLDNLMKTFKNKFD